MVVTVFSIALACLAHLLVMRRHEFAMQNAKAAANQTLMQLHWQHWETKQARSNFVSQMGRDLGGSEANSWMVEVIDAAKGVTQLPTPNPATLDSFEVNAIKQIQSGATEVKSDIWDGEIRYVLALKAGKSCVNCHATLIGKPLTGRLAIVSVRRKP